MSRELIIGESPFSVCGDHSLVTFHWGSFSYLLYLVLVMILISWDEFPLQRICSQEGNQSESKNSSWYLRAGRMVVKASKHLNHTLWFGFNFLSSFQSSHRHLKLIY